MSYTFRKNADDRLRRLVAEAILLCQDADIPISTRVEFRYDNAESRHGQCTRYSNTDYCEISISKQLVNDADMKNTIIHELIHTCQDCTGHGSRWQMYARRIYTAYGIEITRVAEKEHTPTNIKSSKRKYFTEAEYNANKDILVAIRVADEEKPRWFIKRTSSIARNINGFNYQGRKLVIVENY